LQWGEALGARLEDMLAIEKLNYDQASILDPEKQKLLLQQDEEEDFLDECKLIKCHTN
jgi:hypothetical protein